MKKITLIIFLVLLSFTNNKAQTITYKGINRKMNEYVGHADFIGMDENKQIYVISAETYSLISKKIKLTKLNSNFDVVFTKSIEPEKKYGKIESTALFRNEIQIVYSKNYSEKEQEIVQLYAEKYAISDGSFIKSIPLYKEPRKEKEGATFDERQETTFYTSPNKKYSCFYFNKKMFLWNEQLEEIWSEEFSYDKVVSIEVNDNGNITALGIDETSINLIHYNSESNKLSESELSNQNKYYRTAKIKIREDENQLYVFSLYGTKGEYLNLFTAQGVQVNIFDYTSFKEKKTYKILFSEKETVDFTDESKVGEGIDWSVLNDVYFKDGTYTILINTKYDSQCLNLILLEIHDDTKVSKSVIQKTHYDRFFFTDGYIIQTNNKEYLFYSYQELGFYNFKIKVCEKEENLTLVNCTENNTQNCKKILLNLDNVIKINDNKFLAIASCKSKLGVATIEF